MRVFVKGQVVALGRNDYVKHAVGLEGQIYIRGGVAYKVWNDPGKMIPVGKIRELQVLTRPEVVAPKEVITRQDGTPIGHTMDALFNTYPLCKLFNRKFKREKGMSSDSVMKLVLKMRESTEFIHSCNVLVVDTGEMNFLVDSALKVVYFIDVGSYQTRHYPATAVSPLTYDRHSPPNTFDEGTDWFSWGITTFRLLTGIHPYRGTHPTLKTLDERMLSNVSVLNCEVSVNHDAVPRWEEVIPVNYLDWYRAVFEEGKRVAPPKDLQSVAVALRRVPRVVTVSQGFDVRVLRDFGEEITDAIVWGRGQVGAYAVKTGKGIHVGRASTPAGGDGDTHLLRLRGDTPGGALMVWKDRRGKLRFGDVSSGEEVSHDMGADAIMSYRGVVCLKVGDGLYEVVARKVGKKVLLSATRRGNVMVRATEIFDGVAIQDMLGSWFATIVSGPGKCYTVPLPSLKGSRIVEAKYEEGVLMVLGAKGGKYSRHVFRSEKGRVCFADERVADDVEYHELNFAVLDSGVCACVAEDGMLELFFTDPRRGNEVRNVKDKGISTEMHLFADGGTLCFFRGTKTYSLRTR